MEHVHFGEVFQRITTYREKTYSYASKNIRIGQIKLNTWNLTELLMEVTKVDVATIQEICSKIALRIHPKLIPGVVTAAELLAVTEGVTFDLLHPDYSSNPYNGIAIQGRGKGYTAPERNLYPPPEVMYTPVDKNPFSIVLKGSKHKSKPTSLGLDALNLLQKIQWEINPRIFQLEEKPNKTLEEDAWKQFNTFKLESRRRYKEYLHTPFYFKWKFDRRGRAYSMGYHINLQSTDYKKALLQFSKREIIT